MARKVEAVDKREAMGLDVTPVCITNDPDRDASEALGD